MLLKMISPFTLMGIVLMNILSVLLSLFTSDMMMLWFYMEVGMLSFVLMLMSNVSKKSASMSLKYFIFQSVCSVYLLFFMLSGGKSWFIPIVLIFMKMGMAPFHLWFMGISKHIGPLVFIWMSLIQKVVPLMMCSLFYTLNVPFCILIYLSLILSTMNVLVQVKMMGVLAGSSVFSGNWLMLSCGLDLILLMKFLTVYGILLYIVMLLEVNSSLFSLSEGSMSLSSSKMELFFMMLFLGGLPPSPLFFMKLEVLLMLVAFGSLSLVCMMLLCSSVTFYGYMNINMMKLCLESRLGNMTPGPLSTSKLAPLVLTFLFALLAVH